ncbi:MAG TPA: hypothetical protein VJ698_10960 [Noviherbaspirillum sp.]|uniref:hypothetical protein n=1 Tax=Noviherbaspirillum sp. TaxID=1926288 RepID=UPI002B497542|nr:hypothetical protein [Noviherbaspirillum sp.]HJV85982.1 hypothetical protein [Noviherbaspirillum sp.]
MKHAFLTVALALLAGCATTPGPSDGTVQGNNDVYNDPTYPGPGVHLGIGIGRWGGHTGGGAGIGLGW